MPINPPPCADSLPPRLSCDVAIVGHGPVGLTLAALLAQLGLKVMVVERHAQRYTLSRAGHLDGETMRTFQRLGMAEQVELIARPVPWWQLVTAEREVLATLKLGDDGAGWKDSYLAYQPELEALIDARGRALGVRAYRGATATRIEQNPNGVRLSVVPSAHPQAQPSLVEAAYVVGCDGARSFVRQAIGVECRDLGFSETDQLVIDFEHHDPDRDMPELPEVYQVLDAERPHLAGRWQGGRWSRWEFSARPGEDRALLESPEFCWRELAKWNITPADGCITRSTVYTFEGRLAKAWRVGRVLLAGDAAHTMPPFMGQGMLSGIRDAVNLSWKLAAVLNGEAGDALLDTYQSERLPHAEAVIGMSMAVGELVLMKDPARARERDQQLRAGQVLRPALFPRLGPGIVRDAEAPGAIDAEGRPAPQARVALKGRIGRLDDFAGTGWRIVSRHALPDSLFNDQQAALMAALEMEVVHVSRAAGDAHYIDIDAEFDQWFRRTGRKVFIQRPDMVVFGTCATVQDLPALLDELATALDRHGMPMPVDLAL